MCLQRQDVGTATAPKGSKQRAQREMCDTQDRTMKETKVGCRSGQLRDMGMESRVGVYEGKAGLDRSDNRTGSSTRPCFLVWSDRLPGQPCLGGPTALFLPVLAPPPLHLHRGNRQPLEATCQFPSIASSFPPRFRELAPSPIIFCSIFDHLTPRNILENAGCTAVLGYVSLSLPLQKFGRLIKVFRQSSKTLSASSTPNAMPFINMMKRLKKPSIPNDRGPPTLTTSKTYASPQRHY